MVEIVDILIVLGIGSIFATLVGAVLKYIFDKENEVLKYRLLISEKMIDKLHDYIKNYYAQLIIQAEGLLYYLQSKSKTSEGITEERYIKYSFFFLAKFFSAQYTLRDEIGGIILESHEAEYQIASLWDLIDNKANLDVSEVAILRKYIEPAHDETWLNVNEFLSRIDRHKELEEAYEKFKITLSNKDTVEDLIELLVAFTDIFEYHINLIYKSWYKFNVPWYRPYKRYKSIPKQPTEALQILENFGNQCHKVG